MTALNDGISTVRIQTIPASIIWRRHPNPPRFPTDGSAGQGLAPP